MALLEKVSHLGWALRFEEALAFPVSALCLPLVDKDVNTHACLPAAMLPMVMVIVTSEPISPKELLYKLPLSWGLFAAIEK